MTPRERVYAVLRREEPDVMPFTIYDFLLPRGAGERAVREAGLGLIHRTRVWSEEMPHVTVEQRLVDNVLHTMYKTPVGNISTKQRTGLPDFSGGLWTFEHPVKEVEDYEVVEYMVEDTICTPNYRALLDAERHLGGDGLAIVRVEATPLQWLLKWFMGYRTWALGLYRHRREMEELMKVMARKQREIYGIVAESPGEVVQTAENMNSVVTSPSLFERYCLPYYEEYGRLLHAKDKLYVAHMDGKLRSLKNLIRNTHLDAVEAFTPPPMGDLSLKEALETWGDKFIIWANFPGSICQLGEEALRSYAVNFVREAFGTHGFIMGVTEDIPNPDISLKVIAEAINTQSLGS